MMTEDDEGDSDASENHDTYIINDGDQDGVD